MQDIIIHAGEPVAVLEIPVIATRKEDNNCVRLVAWSKKRFRKHVEIDYQPPMFMIFSSPAYPPHEVLFLQGRLRMKFRRKEDLVKVLIFRDAI